jgi:hypothetical protein
MWRFDNHSRFLEALQRFAKSVRELVASETRAVRIDLAPKRLGWRL